MNHAEYSKNRQIIGTFLAVCHRIYEGSMGTDHFPPVECRLETNPRDVLMDMDDALRAAYLQLSEPHWCSMEEWP